MSMRRDPRRKISIGESAMRAEPQPPKPVVFNDSMFYLVPKGMRIVVSLNGEAKRCPSIPPRLRNKVVVIGIEAKPDNRLLIADPGSIATRKRWCTISPRRLEIPEHELEALQNLRPKT